MTGYRQEALDAADYHYRPCPCTRQHAHYDESASPADVLPARRADGLLPTASGEAAASAHLLRAGRADRLLPSPTYSEAADYQSSCDVREARRSYGVLPSSGARL